MCVCVCVCVCVGVCVWSCVCVRVLYLRSLTMALSRRYWNHLGDAGMAALCASLMKEPQPVLETLVVYNNEVTEIGALAVSEMLKRNTVLNSLALVSNTIGEEGCVALCDALTVNTTLTCLDVSKSHLGWNVVNMSRVFEENKSLTAVNLCGNMLNPEESSQFAIALRENRVLRTLTLSVVTLPVQELLGYSIPVCDTLAFASMELSTVDACFIAKCLRTNHRLTSLECVARGLHAVMLQHPHTWWCCYCIVVVVLQHVWELPA